VDREDRVAREVRLVRQHAFAVNRDQFRGGHDQIAGDSKCLAELGGARAPLLKPKAVVLDIEQDALPRRVQPIAQLGFVARPPVGNLWPRGSAV
jgi:hypothetical protein